MSQYIDDVSHIGRKGNKIIINDLRHPKDVSTFYKIFRNIANVDNPSKIHIDFSSTRTVFPNAGTPICAAITYLRSKGFDIVIDGIADFVEATHLCCPISINDCNSYQLSSPLNKVWRFSNSEGVFGLVKAMTDAIFVGSECEKGVVDGFEWCINEIMDNVLQHSGSMDGFIMGQWHQASQKIAVCISDYGIGLHSSLQSYKTPPRNHLDAITLAIQERVTRDESVGQGNGLWGLSSIVENNNGSLCITSGTASLFIRKAIASQFRNIPVLSNVEPGTIIDFQLNTNVPINMSKALKYEHINLRLESFESETGRYRIIVKDHTQGTGTRESARSLRNVALNVLHDACQLVIIDFSGVGVVSSSFADEFVAKLILKIGFINFYECFRVTGVSASVRGIIEKAIGQRISQEYISKS